MHPALYGSTGGSRSVFNTCLGRLGTWPPVGSAAAVENASRFHAPFPDSPRECDTSVSRASTPGLWNDLGMCT